MNGKGDNCAHPSGTDLPSDVEADAGTEMSAKGEPSKECVVNSCHNYGNKDRNFFCNSCYSYIQEELQKRYGSKESRDGSCLTPNCPNNSSFGEMCHDCINMFQSRKPVHYVSQMSRDKCEITGCRNYGHVDKSNLCNDCFNTHHFNCRTKSCQNFSLAKNKFLCNICMKSMGVSEQLDGTILCSSPVCHRPADANCDGRCWVCFASDQDQGASGDPFTAKGSIPAIYVPSNSEASAVAEEWKMCATPDCRNVEAKNGYCSECTMKNYESKNNQNQCTTTGCSKQGFQHFQNLCLECFKLGKHPVTPPLAADHENSKKCKTPDCQFFGSPENIGLCSQCFNKYTKISASTQQFTPKPLSSSCNQICLTPGCDFYGHPETKNLCSGCFKNYLEKEDTPKKPDGRRRHATGPSALGGDNSNTEAASADGRELSPLITSPVPKTLDFAQSPTVSDPSGTEPVVYPSTAVTSGTEPVVYPSNAVTSGAMSSPSKATIVKTHSSTSASETCAGQKSPSTPSSDRTSSPMSVSTSASSSPGEFIVLAEKCVNDKCERKCVKETFPYCMSCFESLKLQPTAPCEPASMPLSRHNSETLGVPELKLRSASNPDLSSLSDECERPGCINAVSPSTYPLCLDCARSAKPEGKARLENGSGHDGQTASSFASLAQQGTPGQRPAVPAISPIDNKAGHSARSKISLKPVTADACTVPCSVMVCLWNKENIRNCAHDLLTRIGLELDQADFSALLRGEVIETSGGHSKIKRLLHCKYDQPDEQSIANSLLKCVLKAESMEASTIVFPVDYFEDLRLDPRIVTHVCLYVIDCIQKAASSSGKHLQKFYMCFGSKELVIKCKEEFVRINAAKSISVSKGNRPACQNCRIHPQAKLKPLSPYCDNPCSVFCIKCLKAGRKTELKCPQHGPCLAPVGHKNTFALLVAGYDRRTVTAKTFINDTKLMKDILSNENCIGISDENIIVITSREPGTEEDIRSRVQGAFTNLRARMAGKEHVTFYFFYSGHNDKKALKLGGKKNTMTPKELRKELRSLNAETILITLDCCYSGGANLTDEIDEDDFTMSLGSCTKDDSEPVVYLPKLWNLEDDIEEDGAKGNETRVYQWSSSVAEEQSYFKGGQSFFTLCAVKMLEGRCPSRDTNCQTCLTFKQKVLEADGVFLKIINDSVSWHVSTLAQRSAMKQHPQLEGHEDDLLIAFHVLS